MSSCCHGLWKAIRSVDSVGGTFPRKENPCISVRRALIIYYENDANFTQVTLPMTSKGWRLMVFQLAPKTPHNLSVETETIDVYNRDVWAVWKWKQLTLSTMLVLSNWVPILLSRSTSLPFPGLVVLWIVVFIRFLCLVSETGSIPPFHMATTSF